MRGKEVKVTKWAVYELADFLKKSYETSCIELDLLMFCLFSEAKKVKFTRRAGYGLADFINVLREFVSKIKLVKG